MRNQGGGPVSGEVASWYNWPVPDGESEVAFDGDRFQPIMRKDRYIDSSGYHALQDSLLGSLPNTPGSGLPVGGE
eukprot:scaffold3461_cov61-Phaeocystis_antarctica.AAC.7